MSATFSPCANGGGRAMLLMAGLLVCFQAAQAQTPVARPATADEVQAGKTSQGGAVFKVPKGYMPAPFADFKGMLLLDPKKPAGMFVTYPNEGETTDSLRQRARAVIVKMFIHKGDVPQTAWQIKPLPLHAGDSAAMLATHVGNEIEVQVATYERMEGTHLVVYGYFAGRNRSGKGDNGRFLDEQGKGVKDFDKLWQSFGGQKK
jgi:hypothetical protein